jgi:F-type H+-transporting ATPase subunit b
MNLNATMLGQMITFGIFVWFTMKFVWPVLMKVLEERKTKIADGLAAAEKGHQTLAHAKEESTQQTKRTKQECEHMIVLARKQAEQILEEARHKAHQEKEEIVKAGRAQVDQALNRAKSELQDKVASLVILGAEKVIAKSISSADHLVILDKVVQEIVGQEVA